MLVMYGFFNKLNAFSPRARDHRSHKRGLSDPKSTAPTRNIISERRTVSLHRGERRLPRGERGRLRGQHDGQGAEGQGDGGARVGEALRGRQGQHDPPGPAAVSRAGVRRFALATRRRRDSASKIVRNLSYQSAESGKVADILLASVLLAASSISMRSPCYCTTPPRSIVATSCSLVRFAHSQQLRKTVIRKASHAEPAEIAACSSCSSSH